MKLSKKKLIRLIEQVALENLLGEGPEMGASAGVYQDPVEDLFNAAFDSVEALGSAIPANNPAYAEIEDALMKIMDARENYVSSN